MTHNAGNGSIAVDGGDKIEGVSPFEYTQLNTDSLLYVGGVSKDLSRYGLFRSSDEVNILIARTIVIICSLCRY